MARFGETRRERFQIHLPIVHPPLPPAACLVPPPSTRPSISPPAHPLTLTPGWLSIRSLHLPLFRKPHFLSYHGEPASPESTASRPCAPVNGKPRERPCGWILGAAQLAAAHWPPICRVCIASSYVQIPDQKQDGRFRTYKVKLFSSVNLSCVNFIFRAVGRNFKGSEKFFFSPTDGWKKGGWRDV